MMLNSAVYEKFLELCRSHDDLTITAGNKCPGPCSDCLAYWKINNKHSIIWIRRNISQDIFIWKNSDAKAVSNFIAGASDLAKELSLLSHEYGHYSLKQDGNISRTTIEECQAEFQIEVDAWAKGEQVLSEAGFYDWDAFESWKKISLDGYYDGFKGMFPMFEPILPYLRI